MPWTMTNIIKRIQKMLIIVVAMINRLMAYVLQKTKLNFLNRHMKEGVSLR